MPVWGRIAADREGVVATPWPCTSEQNTQHNNDVAPQACYIHLESHLQERRTGPAFAFLAVLDFISSAQRSLGPLDFVLY